MLTSKKAILALLVAALFTLFCAFLLKYPCLVRPWGGLEYTQLCYNDLQPLYGVRHLDRQQFPYLGEGEFEYPVVIGVQMWLSSLISHNHSQFFYANLPFLIGAALLAVWGLIGAIGARRRILWFCAGTPLILYAFHNWDLLAVAPLCLAMWAWKARRDFACGFLLGVGASAKLFPGFVFPALWLSKVKENQRKDALSLTLGLGAGYLLCNAPIWIASLIRNGNIAGWLGVFGFHSKRFPDYGTVWYWVPRLLENTPYLGSMLPDYLVHPSGDVYKHWVDTISFLLFSVGTILLLLYQWKRQKQPWVTGGAIVALFLLVSKVHSPQYTLWMMPFFVLLETPAWLIGSYYFVDLVLYVSLFYWFAQSPGRTWPHPWLTLAVLAIYARAFLLVLFMWDSFKRNPSLRTE